MKTTVEATHPWDRTSFTQGVEQAADGRILVGTGQYGESRIYWTTLNSAQSDSQPLDEAFFGEGVTIAEDTVWQLTWKKQVAIKRDADTLEETGRASYSGEGWGLCSQQDRLVMSNGTGRLTFRDPETFEERGSVEVTRGGEPVTMLNELECMSDRQTVWANVWQTNEIYRIDLASGEVTGVADLSGLLPAASKPGADVLNGIAAVRDKEGRPVDGRFYVTGKWWDEMYEVRFDG
ncbi:MAG TPA: glutaminyl-peptide cyclotransferase [Candidatus Corynebacterium gallistercoris]|uniref:Glutaminyl-peptide cyclotransferase n=1 Tax=Candidatus Corynebacterium gallistercoris TaxID=2838530 RepID=A0A9D1RXF3_9CORY|nr:glutaminyl-peptide cyclotransferase [Candidatus Corynebacterium gallistercoris]